MTNDQDAPYRAPVDRTIESIDDLWRIEDTGDVLDGSDPEADNVRRASFAAKAVLAYARITNQNNEVIETVMGDLMGDLQHLIDILAESGEDGGEFPSLAGLVDRGSVHYEAEIRGEL